MSLYFKPALLNQAVAAAGTAESLASVETPCRVAVIQAPSGNAGAVYIGDSTVSAITGIALAAGESLTIGNDGLDRKLDLSEIYVDAANNDDEVNVLYY